MAQYTQSTVFNKDEQPQRDLPTSQIPSCPSLKAAQRASDTMLGTLVRLYRESASICPQRAADACGLPLAAYVLSEDGSRRLTSRELFSLAAIFQINFSQFFDQDDGLRVMREVEE